LTIGYNLKQNYYEILGITSSATHDEIKVAYRKLAFKVHPDRNKDDKVRSEKRMKELNFLYSILSNEKQRDEYDKSLNFRDNLDIDNESSTETIFCNEIELVDSLGNKSIIKPGQEIFYVVKIDKSIIFWKYRSEEYYQLTVNKIYDQDHIVDSNFSHGNDASKTPLFLVNIGENKTIIFKENFNKYWLSEYSYLSLEKKTGIKTGIVLLIILSLCCYLLYVNFQLDTETKDYFDFLSTEYYNLDSIEIDFLKSEYLVSDSEIRYIDTDYYKVCNKVIVETTKDTNIRSIPDGYGIIVGKIAQSEKVEVFLFCPKRNAYKVKYDGIYGWVASYSIEEVKCIDNTYLKELRENDFE